MREILSAIALAITITAVGAACFAIYAAIAVVFGSPLLFVLWLTGAL